MLKLLGPYNICARFAPGYLFAICVGWLNGVDFRIFNNNSIIYISGIIIISGVAGFVSSSLIKIIESILWKAFGNPTIIWPRRANKNLYKTMLGKYENDNEKIMTEILKTTRNDDKLFWKNISYGFFRNSILLVSLIIIWLLYTDKKTFLCQAFMSLGFVIIMTFVSTFYYAKQAIDSYKEMKGW